MPEIDNLIVKITGENSEYMRAHRQTLAAIEEFDKKHKAGTENAARGHAHLALGMRDTRHAIHLLGATTGLEGVTGPAMMGVHAFHLLEHGIKAATASLGVLGTIGVGTGIGAAIAGIALVTHAVTKLREEEKATGEAASKMFKSIIAGSMELQRATESVKLDVLRTELEKATEEFTNPSGWRAFWGGFRSAGEGAFAGLEEFAKGHGISAAVAAAWKAKADYINEALRSKLLQTLDEIDRKTESTAAKLEKLKAFPEVMAKLRQVGGRAVAEDMDKENEKLEEQIGLFSVRFDMVEKYKMAQKLVTQFGWDPEAANRMAGAINLHHKHLMDLHEELRIRKEADTIESKTMTLDLPTAEMEHFNEAIDYAREKNIGFGEAMRTLEPKFKALDADKFAKMIKAIGEETDKVADKIFNMGRTKDEVFEYEVIEKFQKTFKELTPEMEKVKNKIIEVGKAFLLTEEGRELGEKFASPVEKYNKAIERLNSLLEKNKISQEVYGRAVAATRKELLGNAQAVEKFDAAAMGSAEAMFRLEQHRLSVAQPSGVLTESSAKDPSVPVLLNIRDILNEMKRKPGNLQPANLGAQGQNIF